MKRDYDEIFTMDTKTCPFCHSHNIRGGSWIPVKCIDCGAVHFFGSWTREKMKKKKGEDANTRKKFK